MKKAWLPKWLKLSLVFTLLFTSLALWIYCSKLPDSPEIQENTLQGMSFSKASPAIQAILGVQKSHSNRLMDIPGVVGHGIGSDENGQPVICVFTESENVPGIPEHLDSVPVQAKQTGMFKIYADPTARFPRPVPIGVSTGHPDITAGTIGCRVKDTSGNVYVLSNNHVYANVNKANIGDNVLQPGTYDGGQDPADAIGQLFDFEAILLNGPENTIDAAIASTKTNKVGYATPTGDGYGTPSSSIVSASVGLEVQKYGRTTIWTHGEVSEINVTVDVCYIMAGPFRCKSYARFVDQIAISPGSFSDGGDSGSLIVSDDANKNPVGLLYAGSSTRTLANPIDLVLQRFNVTIDDGSGGTGNFPPTADFTYAASELTVTFTDQSSDPDGNVIAWSWDFGDNNTSTTQNPIHTYNASGTYSVSLTVTDDGGATGSTSQNVTVSDGSVGIFLTAIDYKVRGLQKVDLEWSGATGENVDIYRDGEYLTTTSNDGSFTDNIDNRGGGSYTYKIFDGTLWSNEATVTF